MVGRTIAWEKLLRKTRKLIKKVSKSSVICSDEYLKPCFKHITAQLRPAQKQTHTQTYMRTQQAVMAWKQTNISQSTVKSFVRGWK